MTDTTTYSVQYDMEAHGWRVISSAGRAVTAPQTRRANAEREFYNRDAQGVSWNTRNDDAIKARVLGDR